MYHFLLLELFSGNHHTNEPLVFDECQLLSTHVLPINFINFSFGRLYDSEGRERMVAVRGQTGGFD